MKQLLSIILSLLLISINSPAQSLQPEVHLTTALQGKQEVPFTTPNLTNKDFKGRPDKSGNWTAMTYSGIKLRQSFRSNGNRQVLKIELYPYMDQAKSWLTPDADNPYTLSHEQLHFDITILVAKQLAVALQQASFTSKNYDREIHNIHQEYLKKLNDLQELYDEETQNGQRTSVQRAWKNKIAQALLEFS